MPKDEYNEYKNLTASAQVKPGMGRLVGMYVNSTSTGTIRFYDSLTATGAVIFSVITPAIGYHNLGSANFTIGLFATIASTLDVTIIYQ